MEYKLSKKLYEKESDPIATKEKWEKEMEMYYELGEGAVFEIAKFQFNVTIVHEGTEEAILHKLSLAPIIPSAIENKEFESVHDDMLRKGIDYIPYESASKLSTVNLFNLLEQGLSNSNIANDMKISIELSSAKEQICKR